MAMGQSSFFKRWLPVAVIALAVIAVSANEGVKVLHSDELLGEAVQVQMKVFAKDGVTKMWTKMDASTPPVNSVTFKTLRDVEPHGKCRFACYQEKLCGGYAYIPATYTCKLLSAPNFLTEKASNDAWHKEVSYEHTGADYEPDKQEEEELESMKDGLKQLPKPKPSAKAPPPKATKDGHLFLDLKTQMNEQLENDQVENQGADGDGKLVDDNTLAVLKSSKIKLYQEFYEKFAHEYEHRAEAMAGRKAHKIADKRIAKHKLVHPETKLAEHEKHGLYLQARKEVNHHCVRKMQRAFLERLKEWGQEKMYVVQEKMKNEQDQAEMEDQEAQLEDEKKAQQDQVNGKSPPDA